PERTIPPARINLRRGAGSLPLLELALALPRPRPDGDRRLGLGLRLLDVTRRGRRLDVRAPDVKRCGYPDEILPKSPCDSSSGPAVKKSVFGSPFAPALPNSSAQRPSIVSLPPFVSLRVPRCSKTPGLTSA